MVTDALVRFFILFGAGALCLYILLLLRLLLVGPIEQFGVAGFLLGWLDEEAWDGTLPRKTLIRRLLIAAVLFALVVSVL